MKVGSFKARCDLAQQCLPDAPYRAALAKLHSEMLDSIGEPMPAAAQVDDWRTAVLRKLVQIGGCNCAASDEAPKHHAIDCPFRLTNEIAMLIPDADIPQPLTAEQIRWWWGTTNGLEDCDMCEIDDFTEVVRAVEAYQTKQAIIRSEQTR